MVSKSIRYFNPYSSDPINPAASFFQAIATLSPNCQCCNWTINTSSLVYNNFAVYVYQVCKSVFLLWLPFQISMWNPLLLVKYLHVAHLEKRFLPLMGKFRPVFDKSESLFWTTFLLEKTFKICVFNVSLSTNFTRKCENFQNNRWSAVSVFTGQKDPWGIFIFAWEVGLK